MSTPSGELPPPPETLPAPVPTPTHIAGQEAHPTSTVPVGPVGAGLAVPGQTNTLAWVSLISAVAAPLGHCIGVGGLTLILVSIVTGHMARAQIRKTGEGGDGLALAGLIISYVHLAVSVLVFIVFFGAIIALFTGFLGAASGR